MPTLQTVVENLLRDYEYRKGVSVLNDAQDEFLSTDMTSAQGLSGKGVDLVASVQPDYSLAGPRPGTGYMRDERELIAVVGADAVVDGASLTALA